MKPYLTEGSLVQHPNLGTCKIITLETIENESHYIIEKQDPFKTRHTVSDKLLIPIY